jgi:hypothetical protein
MARAASALALLLLAAAACSGGDDQQTIARSSGPELVLQRADLPAAFSQFDAGKLVRADFVAGPRENPERFGRLDGWKARYRRAGDAETGGALVVESRADLFEGSGGAEDDLDAYEEQFDAAVAQLPGSAHALSPTNLGEEAVGFTLLQPGSPDIRHFTIAWREGNATASVSLSGFDGRLTLEQALALARAQQRRIRSVATA